MNVAAASISTIPHWHSKGAFVLTAAGSCFGSFFRVPIVAYRYGGANFLYPYLLCTVFLGLAVLILELAMGQVFQVGTVQALDKVCISMFRWCVVAPQQHARGRECIA